MKEIVDFFIIGAPKAGTTSIANYLEQHPKVCISSVKEPFYFNASSPKFRGFINWNEYKKLYKKCEGNSLKGEGTTWYLYSEDAIDNILAHNSNAKFIVCLRNPVESVVSWHKQMMLTGAESLEDFEEAWNAEKKRVVKNYKPPVYDDLSVLRYREIYKLGSQAQRLYKKVPKENIHIILYDDLKKDVKKVYIDLLKFLNLSTDINVSFDIHYPRSSTKNRLMQKIGMLFSYRQRVKLAYYMQNLGIDIYSLYLRLNTKPAEKEVVSQNIKKEILEHYEDEIKLLMKKTGLNLSHWLD